MSNEGPILLGRAAGADWLVASPLDPNLACLQHSPGIDGGVPLVITGSDRHRFVQDGEGEQNEQSALLLPDVKGLLPNFV